MTMFWIIVIASFICGLWPLGVVLIAGYLVITFAHLFASLIKAIFDLIKVIFDATINVVRGFFLGIGYVFQFIFKMIKKAFLSVRYAL